MVFSRFYGKSANANGILGSVVGSSVFFYRVAEWQKNDIFSSSLFYYFVKRAPNSLLLKTVVYDKYDKKQRTEDELRILF